MILGCYVFLHLNDDKLDICNFSSCADISENIVCTRWENTTVQSNLISNQMKNGTHKVSLAHSPIFLLQSLETFCIGDCIHIIHFFHVISNLI